jgi:hypothetical protein
VASWPALAVDEKALEARQMQRRRTQQ